MSGIVLIFSRSVASGLDIEMGEEAIETALLKQPTPCLVGSGVARIGWHKVTHDLRLKDKTRRLPIVIISGWDPSERKDAAFAAGCNEYLLKPIDFDQLESILNRYSPLLSAASASTSAS